MTGTEIYYPRTTGINEYVSWCIMHLVPDEWDSKTSTNIENTKVYDVIIFKNQEDALAFRLKFNL